MLLGLKETENAVAIQVGGDRLEVPLAAIAKANLVFDPEDELGRGRSASGPSKPGKSAQRIDQTATARE